MRLGVVWFGNQELRWGRYEGKHLTGDRPVWGTEPDVVCYDEGWQNHHHWSDARHGCAGLRKANFRLPEGRSGLQHGAHSNSLSKMSDRV